MKHPYIIAHNLSQYFHKTGNLPSFFCFCLHKVDVMYYFERILRCLWWNRIGKLLGFKDWINKEKIVNSNVYVLFENLRLVLGYLKEQNT